MTTTYSPDFAMEQNSAPAAIARVTNRIPLAARIFLCIALVLAIWGLTIATFGYPALILALSVIVPTVYLLLLVITWV